MKTLSIKMGVGMWCDGALLQLCDGVLNLLQLTPW